MLKTFSTHCIVDELKQIRAFIRSILEEVQLPEIEKELLVVAVDEVCTNIIEHSHPNNPEAPMEIITSVDKTCVSIRIIDVDPKNFDYKNYSSPSLDELKKEGRNGGMGLKLIDSFVDDIGLIKEGTKIAWILKKMID